MLLEIIIIFLIIYLVNIIVLYDMNELWKHYLDNVNNLNIINLFDFKKKSNPIEHCIDVNDDKFSTETVLEGDSEPPSNIDPMIILKDGITNNISNIESFNNKVENNNLIFNNAKNSADKKHCDFQKRYDDNAKNSIESKVRLRSDKFYPFMLDTFNESEKKQNWYDL